MIELLKNIEIKVSETLYKKDPKTSRLGKSIIFQSVILIEEIGIEAFTFKKLSDKISTTEASVYRYFENKYMLLMYLISWYLKFLEHKLVFTISNFETNEDKLKFALKIIIRNEDLNLPEINVVSLQKILIFESNKAMLLRQLGDSEKNFEAYNKLCKRIANIVKDINPNFKYPESFASLLIEGIYHQKLLKHRNEELCNTENYIDIEDFFYNLAIKTIS